MKSFACVVLLVAVVVAEPPRYRDARFERQEAAAPYPAAGYKPETEFSLPARQELQPPATSYGVPTDSYAAPINTYAVPQTQYGVPRAEGRTNDGKSEGSDDDAKDKEPKQDSEAVEVGEGEKKGKLEDGSDDAEVVSAQGAYYVLLPGSRLQRVQFRTEDDRRRMAYTARLRYSDAEQAPLYVYSALPAPAAAPAAAAAAAPVAAAYLQLF